MIEASERRSVEEAEGFDQITERILTLIEAGEADQLEGEIAAYLLEHRGEASEYLLRGVVQFLGRDFEGAASSMGAANGVLVEADRPDLGSLYSQVYIKSQVMLPKRKRPAVTAGREYYQRNIKALGEWDGCLAAEVEGAAWPEEIMLLEYWGGHYFYYSGGQILLLMNEQVKSDIDTQIRTRAPFAFGGIASGQEIRYCLKEQYQGIHGMRRIHYLFEKNAARIKALLHLEDFSAALRDQELIIFGGREQAERMRDVFGSLRYPPPHFTIESGEKLSEYVEEIKGMMVLADAVETARGYYQSEEFGRRQQRIAAGEVQPRVMIITCRWTTFLQHCAKDFEKAFGEAGCETRFLIEDNDVQTLSGSLIWREAASFRPDVVFQVSHARASANYLPGELPFISYVQDKCGPILDLADLSDYVTGQDLFVCMLQEFKRYLLSKRVKGVQTLVMPIPADEKMFYPISTGEAGGEEYTADIGFVNHGNIEPEKRFEQFLANNLGVVEDKRLQAKLTAVFTNLYKQTCLEVDQCCFENEMLDYVLKQFEGEIREKGFHSLSKLVTNFYIMVYVLANRSGYLEALDKAGFDLALYGNGWAEHERLRHCSRGPVAREGELNLVYNFSRINLSINPALSMHQRLSECGLAGGFMMVLDHPEDKDWLPVREYFAEDKEIVLFKDRKEMLEKCRYYLAHEEERREIAHNMHERALRERTCRVGAEAILDYWRHLLSPTV